MRLHLLKLVTLLYWFMRRYFQKTAFWAQSYPSTLKDINIVLPCLRKHGESKKGIESPKLP